MKKIFSNIKKPRFFTWKRLFATLAVFAVIGFFAITVFAAWITSDLPDPERLQDRIVAQSTKMFDRTGKFLLYEVYDQKKRTIVETAQLPRYVVDATIAVEDLHFYEHNGVRLISIARAIVSTVFQLSSGRGGASTLTQQLVKNAILTNERSFTRKIKEAVLAMQIERVYTKDQIIKLYLNEIPYGSTNYGIESASQAYFGKPAKELTIAEAATLAAMPQAPTRYMNSPKLLRGRRDFILKIMADNNFITEAQMKEAQMQTSDVKIGSNSTLAPHFVLYIKEQLIEAYGEQTVDQGGLKVITTLDYDLQRAAQDAVKKGVEAAEKKYGATNGAALVMDPTNGEILSMIGSRDFFDEKTSGQFNVVTQGVRQPGSSFKPVVYAAAFEKGFPPETVFYDTETDFPYDGKIYHPKNYDGKVHGPVTMRQALQGSLNIPAVKIVFLVGIDRALDFAQRLGYSTFKDRSQFGPSVVLGGGGVKMIDHARAYAVFANGGSVVEPVGILRVEDQSGNDITPNRTESKPVLAPEVAATLSNVLSDNAARAYIFGAKNFLTLPDRPVAVKTGTTNDYKDAWTIGYVPQIVSVVWLGNNDNKSMKNGADGSVIAAPIWQQIMKVATKKLTPMQFPAPPENSATNPMLRGLTGGAVAVSIDTVTGKRATEDTPQETVVKKLFVPPHDVLFYVDPENPLGATPENPSSNAQFLAWEQGVEAWVAGQQAKGSAFSFMDPPVEYDDVHKKSERPVVNLIYPKTGDIVMGDLKTQLDVNAPRGITRVEYRLDGVLINSFVQYPFALELGGGVLTKGTHVLKVTAYDDVQNSASQEVSFHVQPAF